MISSIYKDKIPQKYSYVLKTSWLETLLVDHHLDISVELDYWLPQIIGSIFEAHFWLPNDNIPYRRLYVRAGAVGNSEAAEARARLVQDVFPAFAKWLDGLLRLSDDSPLLKPGIRFEATFRDGQISIRQFA